MRIFSLNSRLKSECVDHYQLHIFAENDTSHNSMYSGFHLLGNNNFRYLVLLKLTNIILV
jgi:hypothetical protein